MRWNVWNEMSQLFINFSTKSLNYPSESQRASMYYRILDYVANSGTATNREIATALKIETATISARVNELRNDDRVMNHYGKLVYAGSRKCRCTNNFVMSWKVFA